MAFVGVDTEGLYPAASMNVGQAACFNFGYSPFLYSPTVSSEGSPVRAISEAVPNINMTDPSYENPVEPDERHLLNDAGRIPEGGRDGDGDRAGHDDQNDIHGLSPGRIRQRHDDVAGLHTRRSGGRASGSGGADTVRRRSGGGGDGRTELERQGLVETLIGMGFPIEWAIRAAERSGKRITNCLLLATLRKVVVLASAASVSSHSSPVVAIPRAANNSRHVRGVHLSEVVIPP